MSRVRNKKSKQKEITEKLKAASGVFIKNPLAKDSNDLGEHYHGKKGKKKSQ